MLILIIVLSLALMAYSVYAYMEKQANRPMQIKDFKGHEGGEND